MTLSTNRTVRAVFRIIIAVLLGLFVLAVYSTVNVFLSGHPNPSLSDQWTVGCVSPLAGLAISILIMLALSKVELSTYGFQAARGMQFVRVMLYGFGIGAVTTLLAPLLAIEEHAAVQDFSFAQFVVIIWIGASIFEEVLTRGLVQSFLAPLMKHGFSVFGLRISLPVLVSALFFGLMHMGLLSLGMGIYSVLYIVLFAFIIGMIAGYYREKTGSLIPAIVVHMFGNVGGTCADYLIDLF